MGKGNQNLWGIEVGHGPKKVEKHCCTLSFAWSEFLRSLSCLCCILYTNLSFTLITLCVAVIQYRNKLCLAVTDAGCSAWRTLTFYLLRMSFSQFFHFILEHLLLLFWCYKLLSQLIDLASLRWRTQTISVVLLWNISGPCFIICCCFVLFF